MPIFQRRICQQKSQGKTISNVLQKKEIITQTIYSLEQSGQPKIKRTAYYNDHFNLRSHNLPFKAGNLRFNREIDIFVRKCYCRTVTYWRAQPTLVFEFFIYSSFFCYYTWWCVFTQKRPLIINKKRKYLLFKVLVQL